MKSRPKKHDQVYSKNQLGIGFYKTQTDNTSWQMGLIEMCLIIKIQMKFHNFLASLCRIGIMGLINAELQKIDKSWFSLCLVFCAKIYMRHLFPFLGKFWWITSKTVCILLGKLDKARMNEWLFSNWSSKARHFTSHFDNEKCLKWWNKWPALFFKWTRFFWLQLSPGE